MDKLKGLWFNYLVYIVATLYTSELKDKMLEKYIQYENTYLDFGTLNEMLAFVKHEADRR